MNLGRPFEEARALLGLTSDGDEQALREAYRRAVLQHPPDRDAEAFRRVREAYDLLRDPGQRARAILFDPAPRVAPPAAPQAPAPERGSAAVAYLRWIATQLDSEALLAEPVASRAPRTRPGPIERADESLEFP